MSKGSCSTTQIPIICGYGIPISMVRSLTIDNPGTMFVGCKFYKPKIRVGDVIACFDCWMMVAQIGKEIS